MDTNFKTKASECFTKYDKDNSGFIEISELRNLMKDTSKELAIDPPAEDEIKELLKDFDQNNDKKISSDEFLKLFEVIYKMKENK